jgi:carbon monoxide dehydrogenase subunit G
VPSQSFTHTATADAAIEDVWERLDLAETWESIGVVDRVFDPEFDDSRLIGFSFESVAGGRRYVGVATPATRQEGQVMGWRIRSSEVAGSIEVRLTPNDPGTDITVVLEVRSVGLLSTMFFPVVAGAVGHGLPNAVDAFATAFVQR